MPACHKQLLKINFLTLQRYATYFLSFFFFFNCAFFPNMSLCLCLFLIPVLGTVASFVYIFVNVTSCVFRSLFSPFFAFQLCWNETAKQKATGHKEKREQDS